MRKGVKMMYQSLVLHMFSTIFATGRELVSYYEVHVTAVPE
jgi:hypothetical protein